MVGLFRSRVVRHQLVPALTAVALLAAIGLTIWIWEPGDREPIIVRGAGDGRAHARRLDALLRGGPGGDRALAAEPRPSRGLARRVLLAAAGLDRRHGGPGRRREPDRALRGPRAALDPALRAVRDRAVAPDLAGVRAQVPGDRVGGLGHAALRPGADLRGHRRDASWTGIRAAVGEASGIADPLLLTGIALAAVGPGLQGLGGPLPPVDAGRLPGRAHPHHGVHGRGDQGGGVRDLPAPVRVRAGPVAARVGAGAGRAGHGDDRDRQRRARSPSARSSGCWPGRASPRPAISWPAWWWPASSGCGPPSSTWRSTC